MQEKIGQIRWSASFRKIIHFGWIFTFGRKNVCRFQTCYTLVFVVTRAIVGEANVCNGYASIAVARNCVFYKYFAVFHEEWCFDYVAKNTRCRILFQGLALNAVVNPFGMVGCIAENVDALFYRCVNLKLAFYLIVLAAFADAVIYRGVAVTVVPFALGVCRDTRQKCGNRNDNYVNELSFQGKLLSDVLVYNLVELLH